MTGGASLFPIVSKEWFSSRQPFMLDPRLELFGADQYPPGESKNFGISLNSEVQDECRMVLYAFARMTKLRGLRDQGAKLRTSEIAVVEEAFSPAC
jgi:hypothetical protein